MVYIVPQPYVCPKCKTEINYSPHDGWGMPAIDGSPICPTCYIEFLKANVPVMERKQS